jgi:hypothetical protein
MFMASFYFGYNCMKSKEEILNSYNTTGTDGQPEISAQDLLNAMEAYKDQYSEAAFNAARKLSFGTSQSSYEFATYADYVNSLLLTTEKPKDDIGEAIALVANSILPNFLPDDNSVNELSFDFPMQGISYTAFYIKNTGGYWQLSSWK